MVAWALFLTMVFAAHADILRCDVCGLAINGRFYTREDTLDHKRKRICEVCEKISDKCFICNMPVREGGEHLPDGRCICPREMKTIIASETEAKQICTGVRDDLDRLLSRFLTMPAEKDIQLSIVDSFHLDNLFHVPGNPLRCVSVYGATASNLLPGNKYVHTVDILSHLEKPRLMAVTAHEFTHAWMGENVSRERQMSLDKNTLEAFCELVAYKYMESQHQDDEIANIKQNTYTVGQILVLIEADNRYGFNAVTEWIKNGDDRMMTMNGLDRIRFLKDNRITSGASPSSSTALIYGAPVVPTAVPDTLTLKGISGSGARRFALINNATFEAAEKGKVRVGQTSVTVRCLEIGKDYVTIQVDGSAEKKQLFLNAN